MIRAAVFLVFGCISAACAGVQKLPCVRLGGVGLAADNASAAPGLTEHLAGAGGLYTVNLGVQAPLYFADGPDKINGMASGLADATFSFGAVPVAPLRPQVGSYHGLLGWLHGAFQGSAARKAAYAVPQAAEKLFWVFFDWDHAGLSPRARQIVAQAAAAADRPGLTRIGVNGYTDPAAPPVYNHQLARRRAQALTAELVRDGVAPGAVIWPGAAGATARQGVVIEVQ